MHRHTHTYCILARYTSLRRLGSGPWSSSRQIIISHFIDECRLDVDESLRKVNVVHTSFRCSYVDAKLYIVTNTSHFTRVTLIRNRLNVSDTWIHDSRSWSNHGSCWIWIVGHKLRLPRNIFLRGWRMCKHDSCDTSAMLYTRRLLGVHVVRESQHVLCTINVFLGWSWIIWVWAGSVWIRLVLNEVDTLFAAWGVTSIARASYWIGASIFPECFTLVYHRHAWPFSVVAC